MTKREQEQQEEIERLQRKVRQLAEAYSSKAAELEKLKAGESVHRSKGRPPIDRAVCTRVLSLYQQGHTMREIAGKEGIAAGSVHKIIAKAAKESRIVWLYMDREKPSTLIDACALTRRVRIVNLTDDMLSRAFGICEHPDWEDYENFMESRCMPRTRYGLREELRGMGVDDYDPFLIIEKTDGRVYGDHQWLQRMDTEWVKRYDLLMKEAGNISQRKRLAAYLRESERIWDKYDSRWWQG